MAAHRFRLASLAGYTLHAIEKSSGGAMLVAELAEWRTELSAASILLAAGFAAAVGIFFGYYPAKRASQLSPIEALRYE